MEIKAAARLRAGRDHTYDVKGRLPLPVGGGTAWRHLSKEGRLEILRKYPDRVDLDLHAPYAKEPHKPQFKTGLEHRLPSEKD